MAAAPVSDIAPSRQQEQHVRAFRRFGDERRPMARLITLVWDEPGRCDLGAMTRVITDHLRRHDTYRSWFAFDGEDKVVRHHAADPAAIEVEPVAFGPMDAAGWRARVAATAGPLQWDCFGFGVIQREAGFTFYASIDHVHTDVALVVLLFREIHDTYTALVAGGTSPPLAAGSYLAFCRRQQVETAELGPDSPPVRAWLRFLQHNGAALPRFPLDLGENVETCVSDFVTFPMLDAETSRRFDAACAAVGASPLGGLLACAALTEHALVGSRTYAVITPTTTRATPADDSTLGWFTGVVPILLEDTATTFEALAPAAQSAFADGLPLARVPIERVMELASPPIPLATSGVPMLSYIDTARPPMDAAVTAQLRRHNARLLVNRGAAHQIAVLITRGPPGMTLSVSFPDNTVAHRSIAAYARTFSLTVARVAGEVPL